MTDHERILLVGCGKMGSALLNGWLGQGTPASQVSVVEPMQPALPDGVSRYAEAAALASAYRPSVVVFAVNTRYVHLVAGDTEMRFVAVVSKEPCFATLG